MKICIWFFLLVQLEDAIDVDIDVGEVWTEDEMSNKEEARDEVARDDSPRAKDAKDDSSKTKDPNPAWAASRAQTVMSLQV